MDEEVCACYPSVNKNEHIEEFSIDKNIYI